MYGVAKKARKPEEFADTEAVKVGKVSCPVSPTTTKR